MSAFEQAVIDLAQGGYAILEYNDHHVCYRTALDEYHDHGINWVSKETRKEAFAEDRVWSLCTLSGKLFAANLVELVPVREAAIVDAHFRSLCTGEFGLATISYNEHLRYEEPIEEWAERDHNWIDMDEDIKAAVTGQAWEIICYPTTPIGSWAATASTFSAYLEWSRN